MSADRDDIFSLTWYYPMCTEECGWEGAQVVSRESARDQIDAHNARIHGAS
jgi:hypothetical protein